MIYSFGAVLKIAILKGFKLSKIKYYGHVNTLQYVRHNDLHRCLGILDVATEIKRFAVKHGSSLQQHDVEAAWLLENQNIIRRLKRRKPFELV